MGDFFNFKKMITPVLIKVSYVIGIIIISWYAVNSARSVWRYSEEYGFLTFWGVLIGGQLTLRMICEGVILFFRVHDELVKINEKTDYSSNYESSSTLSKLRDINQPPSYAEEWVCTCGCKNPSSNTYCTACGYIRRNSPAKKPASSTTQNNAWKCDVCGYMNHGSSHVCLQCGENKEHK